MANPAKGVTMMTLNRNYTHASVYGHAVRFKKNVPTVVPNVIVRECVALGAERSDGKDAIVEARPAADKAPQNVDDRMDAVLDAIESMLERNDREDFTGTGLPKVVSLTSEAGFKVDKTELNKAWQERANRAALEERDGSS